MLIVGAGGHAIEVLSVFEELEQGLSVCFFDNITPNVYPQLFDRFPVLQNEKAVREYFSKDKRFVLGVGNPHVRKKLADLLRQWGGELTSVISPFAKIGTHEVQLGNGLNVMTNAVITERIKIGEGTLVHVHASVHHDSELGEYCELSPGCRVLGNVKIGSFTSVGTNALILPGTSIGSNCVIGAGAVVTKDVTNGVTVIGVPAKVMA
jgi:sugar O-acyltransferase (sialic acid O-acetyltransferase NeuD family)